MMLQNVLLRYNINFLLLIVVAAAAENDTTGERYGSGSSGMLDLYQKIISPAKGGNTCPMHPSCSQYAKLAMEESPIIGFMSSCDRLVRCGRDQQSYLIIGADSCTKLHDPLVDSNTIQEFIPSEAVVSQPAPVDTCSAFAWSLFRAENYQLAQLEFERLLYRKECIRDAMKGILETSYRIDNTVSFISKFYRFRDTLRTDDLLLGRYGLLMAYRLYRDDRISEALSALANQVQVDSPALMDRRYLLASLCRIVQNDAARALRCADSIESSSALRSYTDAIHVEQPELFRYDRSPAIAAALAAVVPGAGYLYINRPQTAFATLLINGMFIYTSYEFIKKKQYGAGMAAIMLSSGFYFGNIRGTIKAANFYNKRQRAKKIGRLLEGIDVVPEVE